MIRSESLRKAPTPIVPAAALLIIFAVVISLEAGPLYNSNAMLSLWSSAGLLSSVEPAENLESTYKRTLIYFQTADSFGSPLMGFLLDNFGPRVTGATGSVLQMVGTSLMLVPSTPVFKFAAAVQGVAILMVINACISIGNLLVPRQGFAVALLNGAADLSTGVYVTLGYLGPQLFRTGLLSYVALCGVCVILSVVLLPSTSFERIDRDDNKAIQDDGTGSSTKGETEGERRPLRTVSDISTGPFPRPSIVARRSTKRHTETDKISAVFSIECECDYDAAPASRIRQLLSLQYICFFFFFCFGILRQNFYLNNQILLLKGKGPDYMHYATFFSYLMPSGILFAMLIGHLADQTSIMTTALLVNGGACAVYLLSLINSLRIQYLAFFLFMGQKCCLYTLIYVFVAQSFGFNNFGLLTAVCTVGGGLFNLLQLPIETYIDNDYERARVVTFVFFWISLSLYLPLFILIRYPYRGSNGNGMSDRASQNNYNPVTTKAGTLSEEDDDEHVEDLIEAPSKRQASRRSLSRISNTSSGDGGVTGSPPPHVRVGVADDDD